jgi:antitoxin HigA-1
MAEYVAKRDRNRCPTHPGELLREDAISATRKTRSEIAALLGISRQHLYDILNERKSLSGSVSYSAVALWSGRECRAHMILGMRNANCPTRSP